jgi:hypothetical protein
MEQNNIYIYIWVKNFVQEIRRYNIVGNIQGNIRNGNIQGNIQGNIRNVATVKIKVERNIKTDD